MEGRLDVPFRANVVRVATMSWTASVRKRLPKKRRTDSVLID